MTVGARRVWMPWGCDDINAMEMCCTSKNSLYLLLSPLFSAPLRPWLINEALRLWVYGLFICISEFAAKMPNPMSKSWLDTASGWTGVDKVQKHLHLWLVVSCFLFQSLFPLRGALSPFVGSKCWKCVCACARSRARVCVCVGCFHKLGTLWQVHHWLNLFVCLYAEVVCNMFSECACAKGHQVHLKQDFSFKVKHTSASLWHSIIIWWQWIGFIERFEPIIHLHWWC